jgi:hypothetical protein
LGLKKSFHDIELSDRPFPRLGAKKPELEFLKSLWGIGTEEEEGYRTGPPGYIGWRNSFLGIDSGAPYTFKNTGSGSYLVQSMSNARETSFFQLCFSSERNINI